MHLERERESSSNSLFDATDIIKSLDETAVAADKKKSLKNIYFCIYLLK